MEIARHWRLREQRYRLIGEKCPHCEEMIFPPRDICPRCRRGTLVSNLDVSMGEPLVIRVVGEGSSNQGPIQR